MAYMEDLQWPSPMWAEENEIQNALDAAGYQGPATNDSLKDCFLDYVAAGYWADLTLEDARADVENGLITTNQMIRALQRRRGRLSNS